MNFAALRYFVEIVQQGSLNKAARNIYTTPSTLTAALNSLENELGFKLVIRTRQGVSPTREGELFYNDALVILQMQERWSMFPTGKQQLQVNAIPAIYDSVLPDIILKMAEQNPLVSIRPVSQTVLEIDQALLQGDIHFAFRGYLPGEEDSLKIFARNLGLEISFLFHDSYRIFCNRTHPFSSMGDVSSELLKNMDGACVLFPSSYKFPYIQLFNPERTLYLCTQLGVLHTIRQTQRFGILPQIFSHSIYCSDGQIINLPINKIEVPLNYAFLYPLSETCSSYETLFINLVHEYFKNIHL